MSQQRETDDRKRAERERAQRPLLNALEEYWWDPEMQRYEQDKNGNDLDPDPFFSPCRSC